MNNGVNARPHPGLLPQGEGELLAGFLKCRAAAMAGAALSKQAAAKGDSLSACPSPAGAGEGGKAG